MRSSLLLGLALVLFSARGLAQQPPARTVTLAEVLERAKNNPPAVLAAAASLQRFEAQEFAARGAYLPRLTLQGQGGVQYSNSPTIAVVPDPNSPLDANGNPTEGIPVEARLKSTALNTQATAALDWTLLDFSRGRRVDAARAYKDAQGFALSSAQRRAVQAAVDLYLRSLFGERLIADARLSFERRTDQQRSITALVKAGIRPAADAQRAEIETVAARHAVEIRSVEYMATNAALAAALGEDPARPLRPAAIDPSTFTAPLALGDATRLALEQRPEIRQAEATLAARQAEHGAARGARAPTLGVAGNGQVSYTDIRKGAGLSGEQYVGGAFMYLRWSALDATVWRQAKVTYQAVLEAQRQLEANILALRAEVAEATYAALRAQAQLAQAEEILSAATTARQAQNERYRAGAATLLELLDAEEIEQRARVTRIEAEREYHVARAALLAVCGASDRLAARGAPAGSAPPP